MRKLLLFWFCISVCAMEDTTNQCEVTFYNDIFTHVALSTDLGALQSGNLWENEKVHVIAPSTRWYSITKERYHSNTISLSVSENSIVYCYFRLRDGLRTKQYLQGRIFSYYHKKIVSLSALCRSTGICLTWGIMQSACIHCLGKYGGAI